MTVLKMTSLLILLMVNTVLVILGSASTNLQCTDWEGKKIAEGSKFKARLDPCETCICEGGHAVSCFSPGCAAPPDCKDGGILEEVEGECCRFNCIKPADLPPDYKKKRNHTTDINNQNPTTYGGVDNANLGLRLVASTVTSFLILALLLFMVHRLRQRRILIMMRRINEEQSQDDAVAYMSHFDHFDMGIEFPPYEDPPPPYTPHKPQDIPLGEAPPPYQANPPNNNNNVGETESVDNGTLNNRNGGRPLQGSLSNNINSPWNGPSVSDSTDLQRSPSDSSISTASTPSTAPVSPSGGPIVISYDNFRTTTPSRVMVCLENDSPRTSLVHRPPSRGAAASNYIKRSDSMEIKVGSCNPRNSYSHDGDETVRKNVAAAAGEEDDVKGRGDDDGDESQDDFPAAASGLGSINLSWNRGPRPQRIAIRSQNGLASSTGSSPSVSSGTNSPDTGQTLSGGHLSRQASTTSDVSNQNPDLPVSTRRSPVASWGPVCSIDRPRSLLQEPSRDLGPAESGDIGRSASMTSQFSVCSETGEKRPKLTLPLVIPNDAQYPDAMFYRCSGPEHPDITPGHASGASGPSTPGSSEPTLSPTTDVSQPSDLAAAANPRPRISYIDMNSNMVSTVPSEAAAAGPILHDNSSRLNDLTKNILQPKPAKSKGDQRVKENNTAQSSTDWHPLSKRSDKGSTYKHYGFVENPERLSRRDKEKPGSSSNDRSAESKRDNSRDKKRDHSREKRQENILDRRRDSCQEKHVKSRERNSSSRDSSKDRVRSNSRGRQARNRSCSTERTKTNVASNDCVNDNKAESTLKNGYIRNATVNDMLTSLARPKKDSRPLERDISQPSASLERHRKRRPASVRYIPEAGQVMAAILTSGHSDMYEAPQTSNDWKRQQPSKKSQDNRHSIPLISRSRNGVDR